VWRKTTRLRPKHPLPIRGEIDAKNQTDIEVQNDGTKGGIEAGTVTERDTAIAAGTGRGGVTALRVGRRTAASEEEAVVQIMVAIGKRDDGAIITAAVAAAMCIIGRGATGVVVGVGVEAELRSQGTMIDGAVGAEPGVAIRILKDKQPVAQSHRPWV
jgi:hypothetical protein